MTLHTSRDQPAAPAPTSTTWSPRTYVDLLTQQLAGIAQLNQTLRSAQQTESAAAHSREARMDADRRLQVLTREHQAVVERTHQQLQASGQLLSHTASRTVLLAHRSTWLLDRISATLHEQGLEVVARLDNGADAVGYAVAEQPDLLLVEDLLPLVPGEQVVRKALRLCPHTRLIVHADHADRVGPLLEAGAAAVYTRRVTPADIATGMSQLLTA